MDNWRSAALKKLYVIGEQNVLAAFLPSAAPFKSREAQHFSISRCMFIEYGDFELYKKTIRI